MSSSKINTSSLPLPWKTEPPPSLQFLLQRRPYHIRIQDVQFHTIRKTISFHIQFLLINLRHFMTSVIPSILGNRSPIFSFSSAVATSTSTATLRTASSSIFQYVCFIRVSEFIEKRLFVKKRTRSTGGYRMTTTHSFHSTPHWIEENCTDHGLLQRHKTNTVMQMSVERIPRAHSQSTGSRLSVVRKNIALTPPTFEINVRWGVPLIHIRSEVKKAYVIHQDHESDVKTIFPNHQTTRSTHDVRGSKTLHTAISHAFLLTLYTCSCIILDCIVLDDRVTTELKHRA